jgi:hypothetical protein
MKLILSLECMQKLAKREKGLGTIDRCVVCVIDCIMAYGWQSQNNKVSGLDVDSVKLGIVCL